METSIILNYIFLGLLAIGFLSYFVWLGFNVVKLKESFKEYKTENGLTFDGVWRDFGDYRDEQSRELDKIDSRFDQRVTDESNSINKLIDDEVGHLHERIDESEKNLQEAITDLVEDVDNLKK